MWRYCMITIAGAALSYYARRMQWAERDYWALRLKEWFRDEISY